MPGCARPVGYVPAGSDHSPFADDAVAIAVVIGPLRQGPRSRVCLLADRPGRAAKRPAPPRSAPTAHAAAAAGPHEAELEVPAAREALELPLHERRQRPRPLLAAPQELREVATHQHRRVALVGLTRPRGPHPRRAPRTARDPACPESQVDAARAKSLPAAAARLTWRPSPPGSSLVRSSRSGPRVETACAGFVPPA